MEDFGPFLRRLREQADVTMGEMARLLGVTVQYLSSVERGRKQPLTDEKIEQAAEILSEAGLDVDLDELLSSASASRGAFELSMEGMGAMHREAGASLRRGWPDFTDDDLRKIKAIADRRAKRGRRG